MLHMRNVWITAGAILAAAAVIALAGRPREVPVRALELSAANRGDRVHVSWNPALPAVRKADGAQLQVKDGAEVRQFTVNQDVLRSGQLEYVRRAEDILLSLTLHDDGKPGLRGFVRAVWPPAVAAPKPEAAAVKRAQAPARKVTRAAKAKRRAQSGTRARRRASQRTRTR